MNSGSAGFIAHLRLLRYRGEAPRIVFETRSPTIVGDYHFTSCMSHVHKSTDKPKQPKAAKQHKAASTINHKLRTNVSKRSTRADAAAGGGNPFLATLLDPIKYKGIGIPDASTLPSVKFQTELRQTYQTDASGNLVICAAPTLDNGILRLGTNATTYVTMEAAAAGTDLSGDGFNAAGYSPASVGAILPLTNTKQIQANLASVRPVSMCVQHIPIQAALTSQGLVSMGVLPREALPCIPSPPSQFAANQGIEQVIGTQSGNQLVSQIVSLPQLTTFNATNEGQCVWSQQDPQDYVYRPVAVPGSNGNVPELAFTQWKLVQFTNAATGKLDQYWMPMQFVAGLDMGAGANSGNQFGLSTSLPYVMIAYTGLAASSKVELAFTINWEGLSDTGDILWASEPTPNNPLKMAMAENVMSILPKVSVPTLPGVEGTAPLAALAGHAAQASVTPEGEKFWGRVKHATGGALRAAAPALAVIPGMGAALSAGAAMIGAILD